MQPTRRLHQPVDFTDLRRPVLYSGLIGEVKPMPGDFGLTGLRRPAVAGHRVVLVVKLFPNTELTLRTIHLPEFHPPPEYTS